MDARTDTPPPGAAMKIDPWVDRIGGWIERHREASIRLGNLETRLVRDRIAGIRVERPVYIAGLARSGSTILLEFLSRHPDLSTHLYRDFPALFTPILWNWFIDHAAGARQEPQERAHKDRIKVSPESPEAFEEVLWMAFFRGAHGPGRSATLDATTANPAFEIFYRDHIRKILFLRGGSRYLAKANYDITRLGYLLRLFPDARFVVPVRDPVWHVASLMKQHALFCREGRRDPRVTRHLSRAGHFEFGLDRQVPAIGDGEVSAEIERLWREGREVAGWATLWSLVYGHLAELINADAAIGKATKVVRYEDLCGHPAEAVAGILEHCDLSPADLPQDAEAEISAPDYYSPNFSDQELAVIRERTAGTASAFGY